MSRKLLEIRGNIIQQAIYLGSIEKIGENNQRNGNIYYGIKGRPNDVLVHIKDSKYLVTDRVVESLNKNMIDVVPELVKLPFYVNVSNGRESAKNINSHAPKDVVRTKTVVRCVRSLIINENVIALPSDMVTHHKAQIWDERISTTLYIHKDEHKHSNRHNSGGCINSMNVFDGFLKLLNLNEEKYKDVTVVE